jgi:hypothetical protein
MGVDANGNGLENGGTFPCNHNILLLMIFGLSRAWLVAGDLLQRTNQIGTNNYIACSESLRSRCQINILTIKNRDWLVFPSEIAVKVYSSYFIPHQSEGL